MNEKKSRLKWVFSVVSIVLIISAIGWSYVSIKDTGGISDINRTLFSDGKVYEPLNYTMASNGRDVGLTHFIHPTPIFALNGWTCTNLYRNLPGGGHSCIKTDWRLVKYTFPDDWKKAVKKVKNKPKLLVLLPKDIKLD